MILSQLLVFEEQCVFELCNSDFTSVIPPESSILYLKCSFCPEFLLKLKNSPLTTGISYVSTSKKAANLLCICSIIPPNTTWVFILGSFLCSEIEITTCFSGAQIISVPIGLSNVF